MTTPERRAAPRVSVKARSSVKIDGRMHSVELVDISPVGARLACKLQPDLGQDVKLYLRNGKAIDGAVARHVDEGFAIAFTEGPPDAVPAKTFFWKLESYVFSGAYAPRQRPVHGRHVPNESLIESCTVLEWSDDRIRMDTPVRLTIGSRVHLCGRTCEVQGKSGQVYTLSAVAAPRG